MKKKLLFSSLILVAFLGFFLSLSAYSASFPVGTQLLPQNPNARFSTPNNDTGLVVKPPPVQRESSKDTVFIRQIRIAQNTVFDTQTLHFLIAKSEGKRLNLEQVNALAMRITHYYQERGYLVSRAYIPQQTIEDGVLYINVLEARLGQIKVDNDSRLSPYRVNNALRDLSPNQILNSRQLNRSLLLLRDIPGITSHSALAPGELPGSSDLLVTVRPAPLFSGTVGIDNYGSQYIGQTRYNAALKVNNPTGQGDQLLLDGITTGHNMMNGHLGYRFPIDSVTTTGVDINRMTYKLKGNLRSLDANGRQTSASLWASHIWVRDVNTNINSALTYSYTKMSDDIEAVGLKKNRHSNKVVLDNIVELSDNTGRTAMYLSVTYGNLTFNRQNEGAQTDAEGPKTAGQFVKGNLQLSRLQQLGRATSLYLGVDGQIASKNLDPTEQLTLGGPFSSRSYPVGAISGTQGYTATAELRHIVSDSANHGQWTPVAFVDTGYVKIYKTPFTQDDNSTRLSSAGVGLNVSWRDWFVSARYAHRIGARPATSLINDVDDDKVWIQVDRHF